MSGDKGYRPRASGPPPTAPPPKPGVRPEESLETLAERVREDLLRPLANRKSRRPDPNVAHPDALAALATLLQRAQEAERLVKEYDGDLDFWRKCAEASEARERKLREALEKVRSAKWNAQLTRAEALEQIGDALRSLDSEGGG